MRLKMECDKCRVAATCPLRGSSPLKLKSGPEHCHLIGGYGREPVDPSILSEESRKTILRDGNAMTIAEVPYLDGESGLVDRKIIKVFSAPVKHERERTSIPKTSDIYPGSHVIRGRRS